MGESGDTGGVLLSSSILFAALVGVRGVAKTSNSSSLRGSEDFLFCDMTTAETRPTNAKAPNVTPSTTPKLGPLLLLLAPAAPEGDDDPDDPDVPFPLADPLCDVELFASLPVKFEFGYFTGPPPYGVDVGEPGA